MKRISLGEFAEALAGVVFAPDYYDGPWTVEVTAGGRRYVRRCVSHGSARMWANYARRRGARVEGLAKVAP
jgi:hypothetical protein